MAVYAPIDRENFPREVELKVQEIQWLEKALRGYNANYQVGMERRVVGEKWEPEYKYIVLKWERQATAIPGLYKTDPNTRHVLLETTDPDQVIATLKMLLSIEREPR